MRTRRQTELSEVIRAGWGFKLDENKNKTKEKKLKVEGFWLGWGVSKGI